MISEGLQKIKEVTMGTDKIAKAYIGTSLVFKKYTGVPFYYDSDSQMWIITTIPGKKYEITTNSSGLISVNYKNEYHDKKYIFEARFKETTVTFFDASAEIIAVKEI